MKHFIKFITKILDCSVALSAVTVPSATELLALFLYQADLAATAAKELKEGNNGNGDSLVIVDAATGGSFWGFCNCRNGLE